MKEIKCSKNGCSGVIQYDETAHYAVCPKCGKKIKIKSEVSKESSRSVSSNQNKNTKKIVVASILVCLLLFVCIMSVSVYNNVQFELRMEKQLQDAETLVNEEKYMEAIELYSNTSNQSRYYEESQELIEDTKEAYKNYIVQNSSELLKSAQYEAAYNMVQQGKEDLGDIEELTKQEDVVRESIISKVTPKVEIVFEGDEITEGDELAPNLFTIKLDYLGLYQIEESAEQCEPQIVENIGETEIALSYEQNTYLWKTNVIPKVQKITAEYVGSEVTRGDSITTADFKVTGTCTDASTRELEDFQISNTVLEAYGNNVITVSYLELSCECYVKAKPQRSELLLSTKHSLYEKGKKIDDEELEVTLKYEDGSRESVDIAECTFWGRSPTQVGSNNIIAFFDDLEATTEITGFTYVSLKDFEIIDGLATWRSGSISDLMGNAYRNSLQIRVANMKQTRYGEWYLGGKYDIVEGTIATSKDARDKDKYVVSIYADDQLLYTSQVCNRRVDPFKFSVHIENTDYLKIETQLVGDTEWSGDNTYAILSDLVLVQTK